MSVLWLDHMQRLNLHALIGAQRASVDDMRLFWRLQDRIDLSPEEKEIIGYQVRDVNGQRGVGWDPARSLDPKQYEFTPDEIQKMAKVVKEWQPGYMTQADRIWLEPLLGQLENGSQPAAYGATK